MSYLAPLLVASLLLLPHLARAASFTPLGNLSAEDPSSYGYGVSADGTVVVGSASTALGTEGFRWSGGAMLPLGSIPDYDSSSAFAISGDGGVVVGEAYNSETAQAFRRSDGAMEGLGFLDGESGSGAFGVSADGGVVVGYSGAQAFRWANGTMTGLGFLPGGTQSGATGVSADGEVVVGLANDSVGNAVAFRWSNGVMSSLSESPANLFYSAAYGVSADGAVVVGELQVHDGATELFPMEAFRWTEGEMLQLGFLADLGINSYSSAFAVSADGSVVVGVSGDYDESSQAFVWTEDSGMQRLVDLLAANGATGFEGWNLFHAIAVSADGTRIVGSGLNPDGYVEAFLADISPVPEPATVWLLGSALAALACARRRSAP